MEYQTIKYEKQGRIGLVRLNRPDRMNAVIEEMYHEIIAVTEAAAKDDDVRALVLTGCVRVKSGQEKQAFCAGADLKKHAQGDRTLAQKRAYIKLGQDACQAFYDFPKPTIAAINGPARGAGVEMALNCDFVFMAEQATVAFTETSLATFVGGGVTMILPLIIGRMRAKELIYTGRVVNGQEAVELGLAFDSAPVDQLMDKVLDFADRLAAKGPVSLAHAKARLQQPGALDYETVLMLEADALADCMATEDWKEGVKSFAEGRSPVYTGK